MANLLLAIRVPVATYCFSHRRSHGTFTSGYENTYGKLFFQPREHPWHVHYWPQAQL